MRKKIIGSIFFLFTCLLYSSANDSLIHRLIRRLDQLQLHHESYFPQGLFPSYQQYSTKEHPLKNDVNIFFTGLTAVTLKQLRPYLQQEDQIICDSIFQRIKIVAAKFKNRKGRNTYNFWPTDTLKLFSNTGVLKFVAGQKAIADDLDDTVAMLIVLDEPDSSIRSLHAFMQGFTNKKGISTKTALKGYENFDAYSTWFGKKMTVELDACILSNILGMIQTYDLEWTKADSASLDFLTKMVKQKDYVDHPDIMSVYYKTTPIILYHLSRLMSIKPIAPLEQYKKQLIDDAIQIYSTSNNLLDKMILRTALLRWGVSLPGELVITENIQDDIEHNDFNFFIGNVACAMPRYIAFPLFNSGLTRYYFYCPAYNDVLVLEYLILQKRFDERKPAN